MTLQVLMPNPTKQESALDRWAKIAGIAGNAVQIGSGVADITKTLQEKSKLAEEVKKQREIAAQEADPNSPISQFMLSAAKSAGMVVPKGFSAADISRNPAAKEYMLEFAKANAGRQSKLEEIRAKGVEDRKTELAKTQGLPKGFEYVTNPQTGERELVPKTNDTQMLAAGFAKRMEQSETALGALKKSGYDPTTAGQSFQRGYFPEYFKGSDLKQYEQAERNFVSAVLRKESGAAITPQEYKTEGDKYFPRAGDTPEVIAQKEDARAQALENMKASAGPAYQKVQAVPRTVVATKKRQGGSMIPEAQAGAGLKKPEEMSDEELKAELGRK